MASIIKADAIVADHSDVVRMGKATTPTITWTQGVTVLTQPVTIYRVGNLVKMTGGGWFNHGVAGGLITGSAIPAGYRPLVATQVPIAVNTNNGTYQMGALLINTDGTMRISNNLNPAGNAFDAAQCAFNLEVSFYVR